jgi:hypothetical protein
MPNLLSFANPLDEVSQTHRDNTSNAHPHHVATNAASTEAAGSAAKQQTLTQRRRDLMPTITREINWLCRSADEFFLCVGIVGLRLECEGVTVGQIHQWRHQLFVRRCRLTCAVEEFVWTYAHRGKTNLLQHPEDVPEVSHIVACGGTIGVLRSLHSALREGFGQHWAWECEYALGLLDEEIGARIEERSQEEDE